MAITLTGCSVSARSTIPASSVEETPDIYTVENIVGNEPELEVSTLDTSEYDPDLTALRTELLAYLGDDAEYISIYVEDLTTRKAFGIQEDLLYRAASTTKLPAVLCLYDAAAEGTIDIDTVVYYTVEDYEDGTGILQTMDVIDGLSLRTLAQYALIYSDNIAYNMIRRTLGSYEVQQYQEEIIGRSYTEDYMDMSAYEASIFLEKLYDNEDDNPLYDEAIEAMKNTVFNDALDGQIPTEIVAHKIGTFSPYYHDIGIVYTDHPYIITVFTCYLYDPEYEISEISKIVYDYFEEYADSLA